MSLRDLCTSVPGVGGNTGRVRHAVPQKHFKWEQPIPVTVQFPLSVYLYPLSSGNSDWKQWPPYRTCRPFYASVFPEQHGETT